jgi:hypothetical protein
MRFTKVFYITSTKLQIEAASKNSRKKTRTQHSNGKSRQRRSKRKDGMRRGTTITSYREPHRIHNFRLRIDLALVLARICLFGIVQPESPSVATWRVLRSESRIRTERKVPRSEDVQVPTPHPRDLRSEVEIVREGLITLKSCFRAIPFVYLTINKYDDRSYAHSPFLSSERGGTSRRDSWNGRKSSDEIFPRVCGSFKRKSENFQ